VGASAPLTKRGNPLIDTKLILLEGPPGSGKSTTAGMLADEINQHGHACHCFFEWALDHPIPIGDDLHLEQVVTTSIDRENERLQYWRQFVQANQAGSRGGKNQRITVLESRFWQTSVMLMYAAGHPLEGVIQSNARVVQAILPLKPVLINFEIDVLRDFLERTIRIKEAEWQQAGFPGTWVGHIFEALKAQPWFIQQDLTGLAAMVAFFEEWAAVAERLYDALPFPKIKIRNPHHNWPLAMQQMRGFLGLAESA
jgi:thymidylate kinase